MHQSTHIVFRVHIGPMLHKQTQTVGEAMVSGVNQRGASSLRVAQRESHKHSRRQAREVHA